MKQKNAGFTLLEVLLSIAAIGILASLGVAVFQSLQNKNDLDIAAGEIAQSLRRAQLLSQAVDGDTSWGVKVTTSSIAVFKGTSYAARDTNYDESFEMPGNITVSGLAEIVFSKFSGEPQTVGTTTLTSSIFNETRNVVINSKNMVAY